MPEKRPATHLWTVLKGTAVSHARLLFSMPAAAAPWTRMALCALASVTPLLLGLWRGELRLSIYASLVGYLTLLNDHLGRLGHRLVVGTFAFLMMLASFAVGASLQQIPYAFWLFVGLLTYVIGLFGGRGAELERSCLFGLATALVGFYAGALPLNIIRPIFLYTLSSYAVMVVGMILSHQIFHHRPQAFTTLASSRRQISFERLRRLYALSYVAAVLGSMVFLEYYPVQRGYWTVITTALVMRPSRKESIYRSLQRLIGTLLGALVCELLLPLDSPYLVLPLIFSCGFLMPYVLNRNYALVAFLVTVFVLELLSLANFNGADPHLPFLRLEATFFGCAFCLGATLLFKLFEWVAIRGAPTPPEV